MSEPNDTLNLVCPECRSFVPVTTYCGPNEGIDFCVDEAPLSIITEVNEASREDQIQCSGCGMSIALIVRYMAYEFPMSEAKQYSRKWQKT